jgi:hypothetical protein
MRQYNAHLHLLPEAGVPADSGAASSLVALMIG